MKDEGDQGGVLSPLGFELLVRATSFRVNGRLKIELRDEDEETWSIFRDGYQVWTWDKKWEIEPPASAREFLERARWSFEDACKQVAEMLPEQSTFRNRLQEHLQEHGGLRSFLRPALSFQRGGRGEGG